MIHMNELLFVLNHVMFMFPHRVFLKLQPVNRHRERNTARSQIRPPFPALLPFHSQRCSNHNVNMRFQLDEDDSDNDSLGAIPPDFNGNTKSRELLCQKISPRIQIMKQSDENSPLNVPAVHCVDKLSDETSCNATIKTHASDMDSTAEVIKGVDLSLDDWLDPNDARDDMTAVTPTMSNKTLSRNAEAGKRKDVRKFRGPRSGGTDGKECRGPRSGDVLKKRPHSIIGKEKIASLPNHLRSLMVAFSRIQRDRSEKIK